MHKKVLKGPNFTVFQHLMTWPSFVSPEALPHKGFSIISQLKTSETVAEEDLALHSFFLYLNICTAGESTSVVTGTGGYPCGV